MMIIINTVIDIVYILKSVSESTYMHALVPWSWENLWVLHACLNVILNRDEPEHMFKCFTELEPTRDMKSLIFFMGQTSVHSN